MRKPSPHQEIAAPEVASDVAKESIAAAAEPQSENKDVRARAGREKTRFFTSKRITQLAMFVAMALVMKLIGKSLTITPSFTVTFIYLPWLLSGVVLGPVGGMIVGGISDVLGNLVYGSPFIPLTFVSNSLFAVPIGLIYKFAPIKSDLVKCSLGAVCSLLLCTLGIGSFALYHWYGLIESMNFFYYLLTRMPQVGVFAVNAVLLLALIKPLQSVGIFPAPRAAAYELPRVVVFGGCVTLFTGLFVTAVVFIAVNGVVHGTEMYVAVSAIYAALLLQSALLLTGKNKLLTVLLTAGTAGALAVALAFMLTLQKIRYEYLLPIAAAVVLLAVAVNVAVYVGRTRRKQNK